MNTIYQAYFGALLTSDQNPQQHPSDKAAVIKYIRRRERRTRAEKNRTKSDISDDVFEKVVENFQIKITFLGLFYYYLANSRINRKNG
jgi:hypothetical protein